MSLTLFVSCDNGQTEGGQTYQILASLCIHYQQNTCWTHFGQGVDGWWDPVGLPVHLRYEDSTQGLSMMQNPPINPSAKFDIRVNVDVPWISLFNIADGYEGTIYPMLLRGSIGSAFMQLDVLQSHNICIELKCYPCVVHAIKASRVTECT